jgi:hypothetical protein
MIFHISYGAKSNRVLGQSVRSMRSLRARLRIVTGYPEAVNQFPPRSALDRIASMPERVGFIRAERSYLRNRLVSLDVIPKSASLNLALDRPTHVVVVPQEGKAFESFAPGNRNFYYEAAQSLREILGIDSVSLCHVDPGETPEAWHARLIDVVQSVGATHVMGHVESDPGQVSPPWSWDSLWSQLSAVWDGVLLGVMFDSSFQWLSAQSRLLARISDRFLLVDICIPMDGRMVRGRPEVGPVNMPISRESLALVNERLTDVTPRFDLSFMGTMYPYRVELVERIRSLGVSVAVNPHRSDRAEDFESSRREQPSWLDYMAGLASSRMTLNFSQSSAGPFEQLKTRVLEAMVAGTMLLTDDRDRTSRFFIPESDYGYFRNVRDLPPVITKFMSDSERITQISAAGFIKAIDIAPEGFWRAIDSGLHRRKLYSLGII